MKLAAGQIERRDGGARRNFHTVVMQRYVIVVRLGGAAAIIVNVEADADGINEIWFFAKSTEATNRRAIRAEGGRLQQSEAQPISARACGGDAKIKSRNHAAECSRRGA